ncbi:glycosyltransferase family 4 protein [soil metagenome]
MENRVRFLMIITGYPPLKSAGMEGACERLSRALAAKGHRVMVLTQGAPGLPPVKEEAPGLTVHRQLKPVALGPLWGLTLMRQVQSWMKENRNEFDFVFNHKMHLHAPASVPMARKLGKVSANLVVNAGDFGDAVVLRGHKFGGLLLKSALAADGEFYLSRASRDELGRDGVVAGRLFPFHNMVDMARFSPGGDHTKNELLYLGRFHEQKNLPLLIRAFEDLRKQTPDARLRMIGKGPEANAMQGLIAASPAQDAIAVEGWTADPPAAMRRARALVMSSRAEGLSNVLVESLACGTPVITTDVSGARDVLDPDNVAPTPIAAGKFFVGRGGIITPLGDKGSLTSAMGLMLEDEALRNRLATEGRRCVEVVYSEEECVKEFLHGVAALMEKRT